MKVDRQTLRYIVHENDENAATLVEAIFFQQFDVIDADIKNDKSLLPNIRSIIVENGSDDPEKIGLLITRLLKQNKMKTTQVSATDLNTFISLERKKEGWSLERQVALIENAKFLNAFEKNAILTIEGLLPNSGLADLPNKAIWHYYRLGRAKLRMQRSMPLTK